MQLWIVFIRRQPRARHVGSGGGGGRWELLKELSAPRSVLPQIRSTFCRLWEWTLSPSLALAPFWLRVGSFPLLSSLQDPVSDVTFCHIY